MIKIRNTTHYSRTIDNINFIKNNDSNRKSYIFNIIINKLIEYKKNNLYFDSIMHIIKSMEQELLETNENEIYDFFVMFSYAFDILDDKTIVQNKFCYINQDINDIEGITLQQFIKILKDNNQFKSFIRFKKLKKINNLNYV